MSTEKHGALPSTDNQATNCVVCLGVPKFPTGRPDTCSHVFCFLCINNWVKRRSECPLCKRRTKFIIKTSVDGKETKVKVRQRTEAEFSHELANADSQYGPQEDVDITIAYAVCRICHRSDNADRLLLCDGTVGQEFDGSPIRCNAAYHCYCLPEPLDHVPRGRWYCPFCIDMRETQRGVYNRRYVAPRARATGTIVTYINFIGSDQPGPSRGRRITSRRRIVVDDDESFSEDMSTSDESADNDGVIEEGMDSEESDASYSSDSQPEEDDDEEDWESIDRYVLATPDTGSANGSAPEHKTAVRRRAKRKKSSTRKTKRKGKAQSSQRKSTEKTGGLKKKRKSSQKKKIVSHGQRRLATAIGINLESGEWERKSKKNRWESTVSGPNDVVGGNAHDSNTSDAFNNEN